MGGGVTLGIYAIHQTIITLLTSWFNIVPPCDCPIGCMYAACG